MTDVLTWAGWFLGGCALLYLGVCIVTTRLWFRKCVSSPAFTPPISMLKPLCGMEPGLYENLRSFCLQNYPEFQLVFGAQSADDPALAVARKLQMEFSNLDIHIVSGHRIRCGNLKVANLMQMEKHVSTEYIAISDSDIRVKPDYLRHLVCQLSAPDTSVVTCLYRGRAKSSIWSRLGALHINEGFLPSVLTGQRLGLRDFGFGATLAFRRQSLEVIGGFKTLANQLADDYMLAKLLRDCGLKTALSSHLVETTVHEPTFHALWQHELRWMRTVRMLQPMGHAFSCITHTLPATLLAALLAHAQPWAVAMPAAAIILKLVMHIVAARTLGFSFWPGIWLLPVRDMLTFAVWLNSYFSRHVQWRGRTFSVQRDGYMREIG